MRLYLPFCSLLHRVSPLRLALQASDTGIWTWDCRSDAVTWSPECGPIFEASGPQVPSTGAEFFQLVHPEDRARVEACVREAAATNTLYECEFRITRPSGEVIWVSNRGGVSYDAEGRPLRVLGTVTDINARKWVEEELRRKEAAFRTLADNMSQFAWMADATGSIFWYNQRWFDYTGTTLEEMRGWGWRSVHHPEHVDRVVEKIRGCFTSGTPWEDVFPLRAADGSYRWFLSRAVPIRDDAGQLMLWLGTNTDITDQRAAEDRLRVREQELQTLADNTPDILTRFDRELRHVFVNDAVQKATGLPRTALLGKSNRELGMPAHLCELWDAALLSVFETGELCALEFAFPSEAGERHYYARLIPEVGLDGKVAFVLGVTHDVTDRKRFEQTLAEQDRRKDEFLATLAHELRNPLAPIRSGLAVLQTAPSPEQVARVIQLMERQLGLMVRLVDDLLDVSRVSQGKIALRIERVTIQEVVEWAVEGCRAVLDAKAHTLELAVPEEPLAMVGDKARLVQVVSNLLTNAAKYCNPGGHIVVKVWRDGADVVLEVEDDGVGIPSEVLPTIWDMFTQVRDTLDKAQGGLGIGLTLVRRLVDMHGGSAAARSPGLGRGSTFTVRLPLEAANDGPGAATTVSAASAAPEPRGGRRVLVVEDNVDNAEMLAMLLGLAGNDVRVVHSGPDAIESALAFAPHAVLVDIGLPGFDGYEVARRLRAIPHGDALLLVALTGWGTDGDKDEATAAGFDAHLTKPVDGAALRHALSRIDQRSRP